MRRPHLLLPPLLAAAACHGGSGGDSSSSSAKPDGTARSQRPSQPPTLLLTVIDDLGFHDLGHTNDQEIDTPVLSKLATEGIIFDHMYLQSTCSPTRTALLTGRLPLHTGVNSVIDDRHSPGGHSQVPGTAIYSLPLDEILLPQMLRARGYLSHAVGKWHLGYYKWAATPTFRGFDSYYGYYCGAQDYFNHTDSVFKGKSVYDFHRHPSPRCGAGCAQVAWEGRGVYSTTLFAAQAVKVIGDHNISRPLFLYLAWQGVHAPPQVPDSYVKPYADRIAGATRRKFAGMVSAVDEGMGNVSRALQRRGLLENIVWVVTSDSKLQPSHLSRTCIRR